VGLKAETVIHRRAKAKKSCFISKIKVTILEKKKRGGISTSKSIIGKRKAEKRCFIENKKRGTIATSKSIRGNEKESAIGKRKAEKG